MHSYLDIRSDVEEIAAKELASGSTWEAGFGRAAVEYWFEDLRDDLVTPLPVKFAVAIAICDLKHKNIVQPDISEEIDALRELSEFVQKEDMAKVFPREELLHMEALSQRLLPQAIVSQIRSLLLQTGGTS